uniref:Exonuclease 3'-5' domain containing 3 n=1 Tax=Leptobrachium leishanense TaxID=445787 RepID=A0A8C5WK81_9ANUR
MTWMDNSRATSYSGYMEITSVTGRFHDLLKEISGWTDSSKAITQASSKLKRPIQTLLLNALFLLELLILQRVPDPRSVLRVRLAYWWLVIRNLLISNITEPHCLTAMDYPKEFPTFPFGDDASEMVAMFQDLWAQKTVSQIKAILSEQLPTLIDPYTKLVDLLEKCNILRGKPNSLAFYIADVFSEWLKLNPVPRQTGLRLRKLQVRAFALVTEGALLDLLCSIYVIHKADRDFLLGHITHLHSQGKYKEAMILSTKLNLQDDLDLQDMCTPVMLLGNFQLVENYVAHHPKLQGKLLQMLDRWSEINFNPSMASRQYKNLPLPNSDWFSMKALSKFAFRLLKQHDHNPALCSNIINHRHSGTLKFLMIKRFVEKTMSHENWTDHVEGTVGENRWLQEKLITLLVRYCGSQTAARWAFKYQLPEECLPGEVSDALQNLSMEETPVTDNEESADVPQARERDFYQIPIQRDNIHFLQSPSELHHCREVLLQDGQVVGVDMEWRPPFGLLGKPQVCLVQLAVKEEVFLLDLTSATKLFLGDNVEERRGQFVSLIKELFVCPGVTKLGYDLLGDLAYLDSKESSKDLKSQLQKVVDLYVVHRQIRRGRYKDKMRQMRKGDYNSSSDEEEESPQQTEKGLSNLVMDTLGKPLDKKEQISNWEKRPLRESQIVYAAIDAYCLLEVYEVLCHHPKRFFLPSDFKDVCSLGKEPSKKNRAAKRSTKQLIDMSNYDERLLNWNPPPALQHLSPCEFSVVCDNMLQGLGRYLRCLGIDSIILASNDGHRIAADVCNCNKYLHLTNDQMRHLMKIHGLLKGSLEVKDAGLPENERTQWMVDLGLSANTLRLPSGAFLQLKSVHYSLLDRIQLFYCCSQCGKIYWDGSHFEHVALQFRGVLQNTGERLHQWQAGPGEHLHQVP